jgi:hypothetical protein
MLSERELGCKGEVGRKRDEGECGENKEMKEKDEM